MLLFNKYYKKNVMTKLKIAKNFVLNFFFIPKKDTLFYKYIV